MTQQHPSNTQWLGARLTLAEFRRHGELDADLIARHDDALIEAQAQTEVRHLFTHSGAPDEALVRQGEEAFCAKVGGTLVGVPMDCDPELLAAAQTGEIRQWAPSRAKIGGLLLLAILLGSAEVAVSLIQTAFVGVFSAAMFAAFGLAGGAALAGIGMSSLFERTPPAGMVGGTFGRRRLSLLSVTMTIVGLGLITACTAWRGVAVGWTLLGVLVVAITLALALGAAAAAAACLAASEERTRAVNATYSAGLQLAYLHHDHNAALARASGSFWRASWRSACTRYHYLRIQAAQRAAQLGGTAKTGPSAVETDDAAALGRTMVMDDSTN